MKFHEWDDDASPAGGLRTERGPITRTSTKQLTGWQPQGFGRIRNGRKEGGDGDPWGQR